MPSHRRYYRGHVGYGSGNSLGGATEVGKLGGGSKVSVAMRANSERGFAGRSSLPSIEASLPKLDNESST